MAFDAFIQIDGIPGESTDAAHSDWIEVIDFTQGEQQPTSATVSTGGGRTSERVNFSPFKFRHSIDKSSAKLHLACAKGTHISKVTLELCRAVGDKQPYYQVVMENVVVSHVQTVGDAHSDESLPVEDVELTFGKVTWTYTETDHKTGKPKGNVTANWDLESNKGG